MMNEGVDCEVTIPGWQSVAPGGKPGTRFVAMWFDPSMTDAYDLGIQPAVETDCKTQSLAGRPQGTQQSDHRRDYGRDSKRRVHGRRFLRTSGLACTTRQVLRAVSDGKSSIVAGRIHSRHFDISVINHGVWSDPADLRKKLADRIQATILPKSLTVRISLARHTSETARKLGKHRKAVTFVIFLTNSGARHS